MANLIEFPELGQPRDDLFPGCRQRRVEQHVLFYPLTEEKVIVDRVLHVRQEAAGRVAPSTGSGGCRFRAERLL